MPIISYTRYYLEKILKEIRRIYYPNKTLIDAIFILIYAFEQYLLIIGFFQMEVFILTLTSTVMFEKICMESRYTHQKKIITALEKDLINSENGNEQLRIMLADKLTNKYINKRINK
jgi:hypothetical protein